MISPKKALNAPYLRNGHFFFCVIFGHDSTPDISLQRISKVLVFLKIVIINPF